MHLSRGFDKKIFVNLSYGVCSDNKHVMNLSIGNTALKQLPYRCRGGFGGGEYRMTYAPYQAFSGVPQHSQP